MEYMLCMHVMLCNVIACFVCIDVVFLCVYIYICMKVGAQPCPLWQNEERPLAMRRPVLRWDEAALFVVFRSFSVVMLMTRWRHQHLFVMCSSLV